MLFLFPMFHFFPTFLVAVIYISAKLSQWTFSFLPKLLSPPLFCFNCTVPSRVLGFLDVLEKAEGLRDARHSGSRRKQLSMSTPRRLDAVSTSSTSHAPRYCDRQRLPCQPESTHRYLTTPQNRRWILCYAVINDKLMETFATEAEVVYLLTYWARGWN